MATAKLLSMCTIDALEALALKLDSALARCYCCRCYHCSVCLMLVLLLLLKHQQE
jgi:hypothetical protein